jgi:cytochrome P450
MSAAQLYRSLTLVLAIKERDRWNAPVPGYFPRSATALATFAQSSRVYRSHE